MILNAKHISIDGQVTSTTRKNKQKQARYSLISLADFTLNGNQTQSCIDWTGEI